MAPEKCPVCLRAYSKPAQVNLVDNRYQIDCPACGRFALTEEAWEDFFDPDSRPGRKLTPLCRARLAHRIRTGRSQTSSNQLLLDSGFVAEFIDSDCPGPNPAQQATNIIRFIGDEVSTRGEKLAGLPEDLFAIIGAPSPDLAGELAVELKRRGLVDGVELERTLSEAPTLSAVNLTLDGWRHYEEERRGQIAGKYGFIAMKFGDDALERFVAAVVKPRVKAGIGYDLFDMRDVARAGIIDNIMRAQIRDSAFVIVDLTHDNSGAYWEAGYAEGLGKPVIYTCERSKFDDAKTHFDTNHCTTVLWSAEDPDDFDRELIATLRRSLNLFPEAA